MMRMMMMMMMMRMIMMMMMMMRMMIMMMMVMMMIMMRMMMMMILLVIIMMWRFTICTSLTIFKSKISEILDLRFHHIAGLSNGNEVLNQWQQLFSEKNRIFSY